MNKKIKSAWPLKKVFLEFFFISFINFIEVYFMTFLLNCAKGIAIGAGAILPGISSGVLCVIFGIYEKLLDSVLNFFKDIRKNIKFLLPIFIGVGIGVLSFSKILNYLLFQFPIQTKSIFIGLILGSIPSLLKEVNCKSKFKFHYIIYTLLAFGIGIVSVILENYISINSICNNFNIFYLILSGFIMSVGIVVPGISSTIILMLMGVYSAYLSSISSIYFPILIPMGIGLIAGCILFMKLTKFLLNHFYAQTFYTIIGFTLGSIFVLLPDVRFDLSGLICLLCIFLGINIFNVFKS